MCSFYEKNFREVVTMRGENNFSYFELINLTISLLELGMTRFKEI